MARRKQEGVIELFGKLERDDEFDYKEDRSRREWCIPPKPNEALVCVVERALDVYTHPHDLARPVVSMNETNKQWAK